MEYKAFQYVLKIAELGNLTRAANELYVSQPSLSHYIARVEQEVGTPLFQRGVSPMRLTPAGEKYAETARMILALDKRMQQDIRTTEARSDLLETYLAKGTCDLGVMPLPLSGKNELESNETAYRLATVGMGLSIVPESSVILSAAVEKPYIYSITERGLFWDVAAVYRSRDFLTEAQKDLVEQMKKLKISQMK